MQLLSFLFFEEEKLSLKKYLLNLWDLWSTSKYMTYHHTVKYLNNTRLPEWAGPYLAPGYYEVHAQEFPRGSEGQPCG